MVVWLTWLAPTPPTADQQTPSETEYSFREIVPETIEPEQPVPGEAPVFKEGDLSVAGAEEGEVREILVRTDKYTAVFSTRGATITSFELNDFTNFDSDEHVQMVDTTKGGAIGLVFTSPGNRIYDTRSFVFEADFGRDELMVENGPREISFRARVGEGSIELRYTFQPDSYEIGLEIRQQRPESFSTREGYDIVWNGGIPFTEGSHRHQDEVQKGGVFARSGGEVESVVLTSDTYDEKTLRGGVDWVAVKGKYFVSAIIPSSSSRGAELIGERHGEVDDTDFRLDYVASLSMPPATAEPDVFRLYIGPIEVHRINEYTGLYDTVDYGMDFFEWMTRPLAQYVFIPVFRGLSSFIPNYGWVIIIFSILIKILLFPLTKKSFKSMARMKELQPRMEAIKEKYRDNPKKQQEATMKMYKETGVNPLGGCLPMLLQYPIIIALWMFLPQSIELRQQSFLWASDLSAPDIIMNLPFTIPAYGNFVAGFTLLMGISMVIQMKMQAMPGSGAQQKIFMYVFPVIIPIIFNKLASGLNLYYLCYNVLTAAQQRLINKQIERKGIETKEEEKVGRKPGGKKVQGKARPTRKERPTKKGRPAKKGRR